MVYGVVVVVLSLTMSYGLALRLATLLALLFTVAIFTAGVVAWWRGLRVARYFIIAWSAFLLGGVVNTLMVLGYLPNVFITMYASQIGSALEVGLLSLALADRINSMREQQAQTLFDAGQKLEVLNQQLANSNRLKDEFLATVTHELRTPMNGVIGSLELMQTVPLSTELEQYQQTAAGSARDMMRMVDEILILTELQAGKLYPQHEAFSLQGLLDSLHLQFAEHAHRKGLAFTIDAAAGLPGQVTGDAKKLSLCLACLLDNGIKFTRQGIVNLHVNGTVADAGVLELTFTVSDSGIGFGYLDEATLYQRFYQLDGSMTREHGGLGIGLAICRQLAELMGGRLSHQSMPGQGSSFELTVRMGQALAQAPARPAAPQGHGAQRAAHDCTVLLVDDNTINQLVIRGMLLKLGYRVRTANDVAGALELLRNERFDAVMLDCHLPSPEGLELCRQLREAPGCSELPVLVVTARLQQNDVEICQAAGITDCLVRPVRFNDLQGTLHSRLLMAESGRSAES
ncbi:Sensory/regulatory protein RpfC [compost metagenome]